MDDIDDDMRELRREIKDLKRRLSRYEGPLADLTGDDDETTVSDYRLRDKRDQATADRLIQVKTEKSQSQAAAAASDATAAAASASAAAASEATAAVREDLEDSQETETYLGLTVSALQTKIDDLAALALRYGAPAHEVRGIKSRSNA